jgi:cyanophycinase-like exopeptidase
VRAGTIWSQQAYLKANVSSSARLGLAVAIDEFIVVGEDGSVTVFGNNSMMEVTTSTAATTATTSTVSTGDVILYTSGSITDYTSSSTVDESLYSQTDVTNSLTSDSANSNREESEVAN